MTEETVEKKGLSLRKEPAESKSFVAEPTERELYETRGRPLLQELEPDPLVTNLPAKRIWAAGALSVHGTFIPSPPTVRLTAARDQDSLKRLRAIFGGRIHDNITGGGVWILTGKERVARLVAAVLPYMTANRRREIREKFALE
jgi:hypothetical protein